MAITPSLWGRRVEITEIATTGISESGYVALLTEANMPTEIWSLAENGGGDLRVCLNSDGTSQLPLEVVDFDTVGETAVLWFRFPAFVSGESVWLFYDKTGETQPAVTDPFGRNAVWQDYEIVSHDGLSESTGNVTPTSANTTTGDVTALGASTRFNGSSSRVDFALPTSPSATATWYLQAVAKTVNTSDNKTVFGIADGNVSGDQDRLVLSNDQADVSDFNGTGSGMGGTVPSITSFNHYGFYLNQSTSPNARLFLNGSELASDLSATGDATAFDRLSLGVTADSTPLWWFDGDIQEARLAYSIPSDDYIATEYANQSSPATFWSTGTPESTGGGATLSVDSLSNAQTIAQPSITQQQALQSNGISNAQTLDNATLQSEYSVLTDSLLSAQDIDNVTVNAKYTLTADSLSSSQAIDNVTLAIAGALSVAGLSNTQTLQNIEIAQQSSLSVQGISNQQSFTLVELIQNYVLQIDSLANSQTLGEPLLVSGDALQVQSIVTAQSTGESGIVQNYVLSVDSLANPQSLSVSIIGELFVTPAAYTITFKPDGYSISFEQDSYSITFKE